MKYSPPLARTFEAKEHEPGSAKRAELNCDALTSEYMPSYRYVIREFMNNPRQPYFNHTFTTKANAEAFLARKTTSQHSMADVI